MSGEKFRQGMHILWRGREYTIEQRLANGYLQIKDASTNDFNSVKQEALIESLFDKELEMLGDENVCRLSERKRIESFVDDIHMLPNSIKSEVRRRYRYVKEIIASSLTEFTRDTLTPLIKNVGEEINDIKRPSWITLYRWFKSFSSAQQDIRVLIPKYKERDNRQRKLQDDLVRIIDETIREKFLDKQRRSIVSTYDSIINRIDNNNRFRAPDDQLKHPNKNSIYKLVRKLDPYDKMSARYGKLLADREYAAVKQGPRPTRPQERVEIDHTKMDIIVVDTEMRLPIGRPTLTTIIDVYSKMITGFYISFDPPSYLSVMHCLLHAIKPKTYVKDRYPEIPYSWDVYGYPETLVVDNGKEFISAHLEDACLQLGIEIHYCPVRHPEYKSTIERYFGTLNRKLLHGQPGTTFSNIMDKADYDPKKNAVVSFDTLKQITHKWIIEIYHRTEHRGISDVPYRRWEEGIARFPPALPPKVKELNILLGMVEERIISKSGIEIHGGLYYNNQELASLRRRVEPGKKVKVKFDPSDINLIHVYDEKNGRYITVSSRDPGYTSGLSLWQHKVIRNYLRRRSKGHTNISELCQAKQEIEEIVERDWKSIQKSGSRSKMARYKQNPERQNEPSFIRSGGYDEQQALEAANEPVLLNADHKREGISDLGTAFSAHRGSDQKQEPGESHTISTTPRDNSPSPDRVTKKRGRPKKVQEDKKEDTEKSGSKDPINKSLAIPDEELDTTGWSADYSLIIKGPTDEK